MGAIAYSAMGLYGLFFGAFAITIGLVGAMFEFNRAKAYASAQAKYRQRRRSVGDPNPQIDLNLSLDVESNKSSSEGELKDFLEANKIE